MYLVSFLNCKYHTFIRKIQINKKFQKLNCNKSDVTPSKLLKTIKQTSTCLLYYVAIIKPIWTYSSMELCYLI